MFWSMAPLVAICIAFAGLLGMCSFAPEGPGVGTAPSYDARGGLQADADALKIPIRLPQLPDGWHANSGSRSSIDGGRLDSAGRPARAVSSRIGYLSPSGMYLALTQSDALEEKLVAALDPSLVPTGTQDVDGVTWIVYEGDEGVRPVWTTRLNGAGGPAQLALQGAAGTEEYRTLAKATQSQSPLPVR